MAPGIRYGRLLQQMLQPPMWATQYVEVSATSRVLAALGFALPLLMVPLWVSAKRWWCVKTACTYVLQPCKNCVMMVYDVSLYYITQTYWRPGYPCNCSLHVAMIDWQSTAALAHGQFSQGLQGMLATVIGLDASLLAWAVYTTLTALEC